MAVAHPFRDPDTFCADVLGVDPHQPLDADEIELVRYLHGMARIVALIHEQCCAFLEHDDDDQRQKRATLVVYLMTRFHAQDKELNRRRIEFPVGSLNDRCQSIVKHARKFGVVVESGDVQRTERAAMAFWDDVQSW